MIPKEYGVIGYHYESLRIVIYVLGQFNCTGADESILTRFMEIIFLRRLGKFSSVD